MAGPTPGHPVLSASSSTWFVTGINRGLGRGIAEAILERNGKVAGTFAEGPMW